MEKLFFCWLIYSSCYNEEIISVFSVMTDHCILTPKKPNPYSRYHNILFKFALLLHLCFLHVIDIVVINSDWFLGYFVGNTLWLVAIGYYLYITFLGYNGKFYSYRILLRNVKTKYYCEFALSGYVFSYWCLIFIQLV